LSLFRIKKMGFCNFLKFQILTFPLINNLQHILN